MFKYSNGLTKLASGVFIIFLVTEFWLPSVYFFNLPLRSYILVFSSFIYCLYVFADKENKSILLDRKLLVIYTFFILFFIFGFINNVVFKRNLFFYLIRSLKFILQPLLIFFATYLFLSLTNKDRFIKVLLILVSISCLVAFFQYLNIDFFWRLREILGKDHNPVIRRLFLEKTRAFGLAQFYVPLAYQILCVYSLIFYFASFNKNKYLCLIIFTVLVIGIYSSATRSALIGVIVSLCYLFITQKSMRGIILKFYIITLILSIIFSLFINPSKMRIFRLDESALHRIPLFLFYSRKMLGYSKSTPPAPTGSDSCSNYEFINYAKSMGMHFDEVAEVSPHNQFLNTFFLYGHLGAILLLLYYLYLWKICSKKNILFGKVAILVCAVNSFFHNAGPFFGDYIWWHICALIIYFAITAHTENNSLIDKR